MLPGPLCPWVRSCHSPAQAPSTEGLPSRGNSPAPCPPHLPGRRLGRGGRKPGFSTSWAVFLAGICLLHVPRPQPPTPSQSIFLLMPQFPLLASELFLPLYYVPSVSSTQSSYVFLQDPNWYTVFPHLFLSSKTSVIQIKLPMSRYMLEINTHLVGTRSGIAHPQGIASASCALKRGPWGKMGRMCLTHPIVTIAAGNSHNSNNRCHFIRWEGPGVLLDHLAHIFSVNHTSELGDISPPAYR